MSLEPRDRRFDGATPVERFHYIILPLLRPMLITLGVLQSVKVFQEITPPWMLTQGGPIKATTTLSLYTYKLAFQQWDLGLAAVAGTLWLVLPLFPLAWMLATAFKSGNEVSKVADLTHDQGDQP